MTDQQQPETQSEFIEGRSRGSGSIFKRPNSPNFYIQYFAFGRLRQESAKSDKKSVAERLLRTRLADAEGDVLRIWRKRETSSRQEDCPRAAFAHLLSHRLCRYKCTADINGQVLDKSRS